jgi:hypothetical protein
VADEARAWQGEDGFERGSEDKGVLGHAADFGTGVYEGGRDLVTGVAGLAKGAWNLTGGWVFDPEASRETVQTLENVGSAVWNDPGAVVDAVTEPYRDAWSEGRPMEAIGRGTLEAASIVFGAKGIDKLAKGTRAAGAADDVARAANAADDVARTANAADDVARTANAADDVARTVATVTDDGVRITRGGADDAARVAAQTDEAARLAALRSPSRRHNLNNVSQRSVAKDVNSVFEPGVDVAGDVAKIRAGQAERVGDRFVVNGRTYGHHDGTLFPMSGAGIHTLDRGAYKALGVYNKFGNSERATQILNNMGVADDARAAALRAWQSGQP